MRAFSLFALPLVALVAFAAAVEPIDFKELKEIVPEKIAGLTRTDLAGQNVNANGQKMSQTSASFTGADEKRVASLAIVDYAAMPQVAQAMTMWKTMEFERETDEGYEKTTKIDGHPAMEKWENKGTGSLTVFVGDRFLVSFSLNTGTKDQLEQAKKDLPLEELAAKVK